MPAPGVTLPRMFASPLPTYTTLGSLGATAMLPALLVGWSSKMGFHVKPASADFHTPPDAVAA